MAERYASLGFTNDPEPLYGTVPQVSDAAARRCMGAGYDHSYRRFFWRYVEIPAEFWSIQEAGQVAWLTRCIEDHLKEDERIREM